MENRLTPSQAVLKIEGDRVIVLAPYPGEGILSCAGAIVRHVDAKDSLRIIILVHAEHLIEEPLTDDKARFAEISKATEILGCQQPEFFEIPSPVIEYGELLVEYVRSLIDEFDANLVYAPSTHEPQYNYHALARAAIKAVKHSKVKPKLAMYEMDVPMTYPNQLLDITNVFELKQHAIACIASSVNTKVYRHITALNSFRGYSLKSEVIAAEAYFVKLANESAEDMFDLHRPKQEFQPELGLLIAHVDKPLVSVVIRSMDRPTLKDALDSIALQTYSNIEVVVVNALGPDHRAIESMCGRFPMRLTREMARLSRSQAANLGMQEARGEYLIFLDDDDLFLPEHLNKLTEALLNSKDQVAYTGVNLVDRDGSIIMMLDEPWEAARLRGANYLPIHAVLFQRSLLDHGCSFNESLECLEDWEFWLQLSQHTSFRHVPGVSAVYRIALGTSALSQLADVEKHIVNRAAIFDAWLPRFTSRQWVETIFWFEMARNQLMKIASDRLVENARIRNALTELGHRQSTTETQLADTGALLAERTHMLITSELAETRTQLTQMTSHFASTIGQLEETTDRLKVTTEHLKTSTVELRVTTDQAAANQEKINTDHLNEQNGRLAHFKNAALDSAAYAEELQQTINALVDSNSWKITAPLRFISRILHGKNREAFNGLSRRVHVLGRKVYFRLPRTWRDPLVEVSYRFGGPLFRGLRHYEMWRQRREYIIGQFLPEPSEDAMTQLVQTSTIPPLNQTPSGRIAIHAHIFYSDLAQEFATQLGNMPFPYDLFVSVPSIEVRDVCQSSFKNLPHLNRLKVAIVPNKGRDIAPMLCTFGDALRNYDFIAHIHGKKSLYNNGATTGWREYLLTGLLGSELQIRRIFALLVENKGFGLVYPQNFSELPYQANTWLSNRSMGRYLCERLGIRNIPNGYFNFPAGSMFWARMDALKPLFDAEIRLEEFPEELGQKDATTAHCIERLLVLTANQCGLKAAVLRDETVPRWSLWGFEVYLTRSREYMESIISIAELKVIVFDIFDTLLVRPFLDTESIKNIVAKQAGGETGDNYLEFRAKAESLARQHAGRDVGLDAIFEEFALLSKISSENVAQLRCLEEKAEINAVTPRPDVVNLFRYALTQGKKVVLASDMYLPKPTIEAMLKEHGIAGWHHLYLSSDIGLRKDSGELYGYILKNENVALSEVLVIGDNEHSDSQIPNDMGMNTHHVLRPVELARAIPRFGQLVDKALLRTDLNEQLTLGLIARTNFHPIYYEQFDPFAFTLASPAAIGYSVLGPMVLSFVEWVARIAATDNVQRLYFLSREGQFLKTIYDFWKAQNIEAPPSEYLVLSRRAVTVPIITDIEDIYAIARTRYFPNQISDFIYERFGVELDTNEWSEIWAQGLWRKNSLVEVVDGEISHVKPLLLALQPRIFAQAQKELPGLLAYLDRMGLNEKRKFALIDVGYAATIQARLNRLLNREVHGYYMITDQRAEEVALQHKVVSQGYFGNYVAPSDKEYALLVKSFALEKLLSSDDAQIIRYKVGDNNEIISELRELSKEELQTRTVRAEIRKGAMEFVSHAISVRGKLIHDFTVPPLLARTIYEAFVDFPAASEDAIMQKLVLDDYYCGRGLVS